MPIVSAHIGPHPPLIVPDVGRGGEVKITQTIEAYHKTAKTISQHDPQTIIIITPHSVMYSDYIHISPGQSARGDLSRFNAPGVQFNVSYDEELAHEIAETADRYGISAGTLGEKDSSLDHGFTVPLYFVEQYVKDVSFVRISISGLSLETHYNFGKCIAEAVKKTGRRTAIIASGDLSHKLTDDGPYGFSPEGPEFDKKMTDIMSAGDLTAFMSLDETLCDAAAECGLRSFIIMSGALSGTQFKTELLSYEGPFGVGYAVCSCDIDNTDPYVSLARTTLEHYVKTGEQILPSPDLPAEMLEKRAGVFVSLKIRGMLRGCIGTISAVHENIAQEIINNAISSGTLDPRFHPVAENELGELVYSVDVLSPPEPITDKHQLDVNKYGVIVTLGRKRGLLLPMLEGVDTVDEQISIALQKAGIDPSEDYYMERFEVVRHK